MPRRQATIKCVPEMSISQDGSEDGPVLPGERLLLRHSVQKTPALRAESLRLSAPGSQSRVLYVYLPSSSFSFLTDFTEIEHSREIEYIFLVSSLIRNKQLNMWKPNETSRKMVPSPSYCIFLLRK